MTSGRPVATWVAGRRGDSVHGRRLASVKGRRVAAGPVFTPEAGRERGDDQQDDDKGKYA